MLREIINFSKLWCYFVKLGVRNCIYKSCNLYCDYKCLNVVVKIWDRFWSIEIYNCYLIDLKLSINVLIDYEINIYLYEF